MKMARCDSINAVDCLYGQSLGDFPRIYIFLRSLILLQVPKMCLRVMVKLNDLSSV